MTRSTINPDTGWPYCPTCNDEGGYYPLCPECGSMPIDALHRSIMAEVSRPAYQGLVPDADKLSDPLRRAA